MKHLPEMETRRMSSQTSVMNAITNGIRPQINHVAPEAVHFTTGLPFTRNIRDFRDS